MLNRVELRPASPQGLTGAVVARLCAAGLLSLLLQPLAAFGRDVSADVRLAQATAVQPSIRYETLGIVAPKSGATIHDNSGQIAVSVTLRPALRANAGHRFRALLDNALLPGEWSSARFSLTGVDRGSHTLRVIVTDADGNRLLESGPVEFHMWQASRLFPNRRAAP